MTKKILICLVLLGLACLPAVSAPGVPGCPEDAVPVPGSALGPASTGPSREPGVPAGPEWAVPVSAGTVSAGPRSGPSSPIEAVPASESGSPGAAAAREAAREARGLGSTQGAPAGLRLPLPGPESRGRPVRYGTVRVEAKGGHAGDRFIPVRHIRISEVGRYRKRTWQSFSGDWFEGSYSHSMTNAVVGRTYLVEVTWADGSTSSQKVRLEDSVRVVTVWP